MHALHQKRAVRGIAVTCMLIAAANGFTSAGAFGAAPEESAFTVAAMLSHDQALDRPHDIELRDDLAFVPGKGGSLAIIDVADPATPELRWYRHDSHELDEAETILVLGEHLLLGTHDIISLQIEYARSSNSAAPVFLGQIRDRSMISRINGMARRGDSVFAACKDGWIHAVDVTHPETPRLVASRNLKQLHDIGSPHDVDLYGDYVIVPDPRFFGRTGEPGKVAVLRVSQSSRLLAGEKWQLAGVVASKELAGANRVQVSGHHAYIAASTTGNGGKLVIVDLSAPRAPKQVACLPFAPPERWGPNGLTVSGRVAFLAGGQSVDAVDISDPENPALLASQCFADELPNGRDSGHDLVYRDEFLYVTGQSDHCLLILRVNSHRIRNLAK